jgi:hypothetical protein
MMFKLASPPASEAQANAQKAETDTLAAEILNLDEKKVAKTIKRLSSLIESTEAPQIRIVMTGAAGSGKTTAAGIMAKQLSLKDFDLDEYIEGGHTGDAGSYNARLLKAFTHVWQDLPSRTGWIIDHVEACHPDLVKTFKPLFAIFVDPGEKRIRDAAEARNRVRGKDDPGRVKRAMDSLKTAKKQFSALKAIAEVETEGFVLKQLEY